MKSNIIKNTVKGIGLSLFMAVGLVAFSSTEANAQYRDRDYRQDRRDNRNDRYSSELYRVAQQNGLRDGRAEGRDDRRDRDGYNPQQSKEYRKATNGYNSRLGNKNVYKDAYRQAFLQGYNETRNRNNRRNNNRYGY